MGAKQNEVKKKYLKRFKDLRQREQELEVEIKSVRIQYDGLKAVTYSGMPRGTDQHDLSDLMIELDRLVESLRKRKERTVKSYMEIEAAIEELESERERSVLRVRYLLGITDWNVIGEMVGYSKRQAERIHGYALHNFKIPK